MPPKDSAQVRRRNASPAPKAERGEGKPAVKDDRAEKVKPGTNASLPAGREGVEMVGWIILLVSTQMVMIVYTKRCTTHAPLPLLLCLAQFVVSAMLAALVCLWRGVHLWAPREVMLDVLPLSVVWTGGFILFNAATMHMSPGMVNVVRCMEPLAAVCVGLVLGHRFSWTVLVTLLPICSGVALASTTGGQVSSCGVWFAMLSNLAFCCRTFCLQRLQRNQLNKLDDLAVFFNVCWISGSLVPGLELAIEGQEVLPALQGLISTGQLWSYACDMLASSVAFFLYQFVQLLVMSKLSPLAFSVLTPVVKALMIVTLTVYYADDFSSQSVLGIALSVGGGYLFTRAKAAQAKREAKKA